MAKKMMFEPTNAHVPAFRAAFGYDRDSASLQSGFASGSDGGAKQSFKEECDINEIVRRFGLTGKLPQGVVMPTYGDFEEVGDFQSALEMVNVARERFLLFPADVRARFENDPGQFLAFMQDPANQAEAVKLGLAEAAVAAAVEGKPVLPPADPGP